MRPTTLASSPRRVLQAIGLCLVLSHPALAEPSELPPKDLAWGRYQSQHFTAISSASSRRTLDILRRLERFRQVLSTIYTRLKVDAPVETSVFIFKDDAVMSAYTPRYQGRAVEVAGVFYAERDGNYMIMNGGSQIDPLPVIYHEYMHYFIHLNLPPLPLWFDEGLAECYETFRTDEKVAEIGRVKKEHVALLRSMPLMPLRELLSVSHASPDYNEGDRRGIFYAESWALVHYLMWDKPEHRPHLVKFLDRISQGLPADAAFSGAFEARPEELEMELKRHIAQNRFHHTIVQFKEAMSFDREVKIETIHREDLLARLGGLLARMGPDRAVQAEAHLSAALALNPSLGAAHRDLGLMASVRGRPADAIASYEKALQGDPADALALSGLARVLLQRDAPDDLMRARDLLRRAVEARPAFAEPAIDYAWSLLRPPVPSPTEMDAALVHLERARSTFPRRADAAGCLAMLYAARGQFAKAEDLVRNVLPGLGDPGITRRAREAVEGHRAAAEQEQPLAGSMAAQGSATVPGEDDGLSPLPAPPRVTGDTRLPGGDATGRYNADVAIFNRAVALANQRKLKEAIGMLEGLLRTTPFVELKDKIRPLMTMIRKDADEHGIPLEGP